MNDICYLCNTPLNRTNQSIEHVIPNAIGGRLKSNKLLCIDCNKKECNKIDTIFVNQFSLFCNLAGISRERGNPTPITIREKVSGRELSIDYSGEIRFNKPEIVDEPESESKRRIKIVCQDKKQGRQILVGLKRKYPKIDIENMLATMVNLDEPLNQQIGGSFRTILPETYPGAVKVFINFAIMNGIPIKELGSGIQFIKREKENFKINTLYVDNFKINKNINDILHSIVLIGNTTQKILFGIAEYFNAYRYISILDENYIGPDLEIGYAYDVIQRETLKCNVKITPDLGDIRNCFEKEKDSRQEEIELTNLLKKCFQIFNQKKCFSEAWEKTISIIPNLNDKDRFIALFAKEYSEELIRNKMLLRN